MREIRHVQTSVFVSTADDEINCEHWPLVHVYKEGDGYFDNGNSPDEFNCDSSSRSSLFQYKS